MNIGVRLARLSDDQNITALINSAFQVERFFKAGDRTDVEGVRALFFKGVLLARNRSTIPRRRHGSVIS